MVLNFGLDNARRTVLRDVLLLLLLRTIFVRRLDIARLTISRILELHELLGSLNCGVLVERVL